MNKLMIMIPVMLMGCLKSFKIANIETNSSNIKAKMWIHNTAKDNNYSIAEGKDVIRVAIQNDSIDALFVRWENARVKIGNDEPVDARVYGRVKGQKSVRDTADVTVIEDKTAVYDVEPLFNYQYSTNPFFTSPMIATPSQLRSGKKKIKVIVEICVAEINPGYVPSHCSPDGDGWEPYLISGELMILGMIPTLIGG